MMTVLRLCLLALAIAAVCPAVSSERQCDCSQYTQATPCSQFMQRAQACLEPLMSPMGTNTSSLCGLLNDAEACMANVTASCPNPPPQAQGLIQAWQSMASQRSTVCGSDNNSNSSSSGDPCEQLTTDIMTCVMPLNEMQQNVDPSQPPDLQAVCRIFNEAKACMANVSSDCPNPPASAQQALRIWEQMSPQVDAMCGGTSGNGNGDPCEQLTADIMTCVMPMNEMQQNMDPSQPPNLQAVCRIFNEAEICMANVSSNCPNPPASAQQALRIWEQMSPQVKAMCGGTSGNGNAGPCDGFVVKATQCMAPFSQLGAGGPVDISAICRLYDEAKLCMAPLLEAGCGNTTDPTGQQMLFAWNEISKMASMACTPANGQSKRIEKTTREVDQCDQYGAKLQACIMAANQLPADVTQLCKMYNETTDCVAAASETCSTPPADSQQWLMTWENMKEAIEPLCGTTPEDTSCGSFEPQATDCLIPVLNAGGPPTSHEDFCKVVSTAGTCMEELLERCPAPAESSAMDLWNNFSNIPC